MFNQDEDLNSEEENEPSKLVVVDSYSVQNLQIESHEVQYIGDELVNLDFENKFSRSSSEIPESQTYDPECQRRIGPILVYCG